MYNKQRVVDIQFLKYDKILQIIIKYKNKEMRICEIDRFKFIQIRSQNFKLNMKFQCFLA